MKSDNQNSKADKLQALREAFGAKLPERLAAIRRLWLALRENPDDTSLSDEFYRLIHSMAGSSGTFGYHQFGACARHLEQFLLQNKSMGYSDSDSIKTIDRTLAQLESLASGGGINENLS